MIWGESVCLSLFFFSFSSRLFPTPFLTLLLFFETWFIVKETPDVYSSLWGKIRIILPFFFFRDSYRQVWNTDEWDFDIVDWKNPFESVWVRKVFVPFFFFLKGVGILLTLRESSSFDRFILSCRGGNLPINSLWCTCFFLILRFMTEKRLS